MTFQTDAIYEGGILRPLSPLNLNEHEVVSLSISTAAESSAPMEVEKQRTILSAFVAKMESLPDHVPQDGLSNRDHDKLIYGK
jgi:predicted DNA-binding antitoxin AbrB/MazE fold protein